MKPLPGRPADPKAALPHRLLDAVLWTAALMFIAMLAGRPAHAGEHRYTNADPTYRAECGSCHLAYPPALLSAAAWTVVFDRLDRHYGVDASLDAATARKLREYATAQAGHRGRAGPAASGELPRISTLPWFLKEHREVTGHYAPPGVKSMADCGACHRQAAQGDFSESSLRVPR